MMLFRFLPSVFLAAGNFGCGGSSSTQTFPPPSQISVTLSPAVATVQPNSMAKLTATVTGDASNSGITWAISCSAIGFEGVAVAGALLPSHKMICRVNSQKLASDH